LLGVPQHVQASIVAATRVADGSGQGPGHLEVVRKHVRACLHDDLHRSVAPAKIAHQSLDQHAGTPALERPHRCGDVLGAAVQQVVAIDHGQDGVLELELCQRLADVLGLARIDSAARIARFHRAEAAATRARVAQDHHGRRAG
jgi:hypothetical protein